MNTLAQRLEYIRNAFGLSLRRTASVLKESGYDVSYNTVHKYEQGRTVPAKYVQAFAKAFGCDTGWLLTGEGDPFEHIPKAEFRPETVLGSDLPTALAPDVSQAARREHFAKIRQEWEDFVETLRTTNGLRSVILQSWERSRAAGVQPRALEKAQPSKVPSRELEARMERNRKMLEVAMPQLRWISLLYDDREHVVYLVCRDGIVLLSRGSDERLCEVWYLLPGYDWSEKSMGTNGAGTALATGQPTAVLGPEHYVESFQGCTCIGAPIRGPNSEIAGAFDLTTSTEDADPRSIVVVAYAAENVSRLLRATGS